MPSVEEILAEARQKKGGGARAVGKVEGTAGAAQHVDLFKKVLLRKNLLKYAPPGAAYVPFCGEGDLAWEHYRDRTVFGADLDPQRVETARARMPTGFWKASDCDVWPFAEPVEAPYRAGRTPRPRTQPLEQVRLEPFAIGDFDSYSYPYDSFRAWWENAPRLSTVVCFFTDGQLQAIRRTGSWREPDGTRRVIRGAAGERGLAALDRKEAAERRRTANTWMTKHCRPWLDEHCAKHDCRVRKVVGYTRGMGMLYWGAVIDAV